MSNQGNGWDDAGLDDMSGAGGNARDSAGGRDSGGSRDGSSGRDGSGRAADGAAGAGSDRQAQERRDQGSRAGQDRRADQDRRQARSRPGNPGADMLTDFQRWLIRSSAKSMRRELTGQVRRSLGGGERAKPGDVWGTVTTEIPPDAGESPECQWCPICRAARRMRETGPGLGDQLSAAGDVVASAVQEAMKTFDSVLARAGAAVDSTRENRDQWSPAGGDWTSARDHWAAAHGARPADGTATAGADAGADAAAGPAAEPTAAPDAAPGPEDSTPGGSGGPERNDTPDGPDEPGNRG
jgi:hypothetical protein